MKRLALLLVVAFICAGLGGCAPKGPTREQWLAQKTLTDESRVRMYDEPPELILKAAERVLYESDHDYRALPGQTESTYRAMRKWMFTVIFNTDTGEDYWEITAVRNKEGKTVVTATYWLGASHMGFMGFLEARSAGNREDYVLGPRTYELFFDRLDYMLGKRAEWKTCKEVEKETAGLEDTLFERAGLAPFALCTHANSGIPDHRL